MALGFSAGSFERISEGLFRIDFSKGFQLARLSTGLEKLAMEVLFFLWTSEGSVYGDPECGTQLTSFIGNLAMGHDETNLSAVLNEEIIKAEARIKSRQAKAAIPPSERLKRIVIDSLTMDRQNGSAEVFLIIVNDLDQAVGINAPAEGITP